MTLRDFLAAYAASRDIAPGTQDGYRYAVDCFGKHVGKPAALRDLSTKAVNDWVEAELRAGLARITIRNYSCAVVTLWRAAHEDGLCRTGPAGIRRVKVPRPIPEAWRPQDMRALLLAAEGLTGIHRGTQAKWCDLARAWLLVGYYSGLRGCDLLTIPIDTLLSGRPIVIRQAKTDWPVIVTLPVSAVEAVRATVPPRRELFLPIHRSTLYDVAKDLLTRAGLSGSPKWLRRTGATQVESQYPGSAMAFLGHKTPGLAFRHYIDQTQIQIARPRPADL
jgi:site-specific recombinase XerD